MNGTLVTQNIKQKKLFANEIVSTIEEVGVLLKNLYLTLDNVKSIINDNEKLRAIAYDYRFLSYLQGELREIKEGRLTVEEFGRLLENNLKNREKHPEFSKVSDEIAALADKELVQLIAKYKLAVTELAKALETISKGVGDTEKLPARIELLVDYAQRKIEDAKLKERIVKRLSLIQRCLGEINALGYCIHDANDWNLHVHDDILFFTGRVDGYFKGGLFKNREGNDIKGIDDFGDRWLRSNVYGSREVKELRYIARFTHRVQEQIDFIDRLTAMLQRDVDVKTNRWVKPEATIEFYNHIDRYSAEFRTEFGDAPFADYLAKNKKNIGMQPFRWMAILNGMKQRLGELMGRKNSVIENARRFLGGDFERNTHGIFEIRIEKLRKAVTFLITQINQIFQSETGVIALMKKIGEGVKRIEDGTDELWEDRKNLFRSLKKEIDDKNTDVLAEFIAFAEISSIEEEAIELAKDSQKIVRFEEHKAKLLDMISGFFDFSKVPTSEKLMEPLGMLLFDFKTLEATFGNMVGTKDRLQEKNEKFQNYNFDLLINSVQELFDIYAEFINFIKLIIINIDINDILVKIKRLKVKLGGEKYG